MFCFAFDKGVSTLLNTGRKIVICPNYQSNINNLSQAKLLFLKKSQNKDYETTKEEIFVTGWTKYSLDMTPKLIRERKYSHGIIKINISALDKMW